MSQSYRLGTSALFTVKCSSPLQLQRKWIKNIINELYATIQLGLRVVTDMQQYHVSGALKLLNSVEFLSSDLFLYNY